MVFNMTT